MPISVIISHWWTIRLHSPEEKVAGYVIGSDPSGHPLVGGGSDMVDDHLFMYQILNDGNPLIGSEGFEWEGERRAWLHPRSNLRPKHFIYRIKRFI